jgi:hypothetical protein
MRKSRHERLLELMYSVAAMVRTVLRRVFISYPDLPVKRRADGLMVDALMPETVEEALASVKKLRFPT